MRVSLAEQIADAQVQVAKSALANPHMYDQGQRLSDALRNLAVANAELDAAEKAWKKLIAPAKGWAPDPLKVKR